MWKKCINKRYFQPSKGRKQVIFSSYPQSKYDNRANYIRLSHRRRADKKSYPQ